MLVPTTRLEGDVQVLELDDVVTHTGWQEQGACRQADPDLFFHPYGERDPSRSRRDAAAVAVCEHCPVMAQCLAYAHATAQPYGVWGGETEDERWA